MSKYGKEYVCQHNIELKEIEVKETLENLRALTEAAIKDSFSVEYFARLDSNELHMMQNLFKAYDGMEKIVESYTDHVNDMYERQIRIEVKLERIEEKLERIEDRLDDLDKMMTKLDRIESKLNK